MEFLCPLASNQFLAEYTSFFFSPHLSLLKKTEAKKSFVIVDMEDLREKKPQKRFLKINEYIVNI
jgi:hypothetical protein